MHGNVIIDVKAMSLAEACASNGKRPEQFPANGHCVCGCVLSRYNQYNLCGACREAKRKAEIKKISVVLPRKNGHPYWSASVVEFQERTPLPQHEHMQEHLFKR